VHEAGHLDRLEPGCDEAADELGLGLDRDDRVLILQPVAWADLIDRDARREGRIGDDLRSAPSLQIAGTLLSLGATVIGYDPVSAKAASTLLPDGARAVFDPYEALEGAHAAVLVTEWEDVKGLDPKKAASLMRDPKLVVDGRNVLDPTYWREAGLQYTGFGRE